MLSSAVANLLQNAFKFTQRHSHVWLRTYCSSGNRILIEIEDECGGLAQGTAENYTCVFHGCRSAIPREAGQAVHVIPVTCRSEATQGW